MNPSGRAARGRGTAPRDHGGRPVSRDRCGILYRGGPTAPSGWEASTDLADVVETHLERSKRLASTPWEEAGPRGGFIGGTVASVREIAGRRELLSLLTRRELKSRYKDSALGFLWSLARPLTQLLIYYLVVGQFLGAARSIQNFAIYIFAGLAIYTLFQETVAGATSSIVSNSGLVKKVYFPREILPLAATGSAIFNFLVQFVILLVAAGLVGTLAFGVHLLYGLASFVIILIYAVAVGLILGGLNVYLRDVQYIVEVVLMLLLWASPILYSWPQATAVMPDWLAQIYLGNPITLCVIAFQEAFWSPGSDGVMLDMLPLRLVIAGAVGVVLLFVGQRWFSRLQGDFAQEL
ncbi:ABC transporter permease [Humibacter sp. BT305]|nr:ABC transporter permease [Humibacter sp. BT305]